MNLIVVFIPSSLVIRWIKIRRFELLLGRATYLLIQDLEDKITFQTMTTDVDKVCNTKKKRIKY